MKSKLIIISGVGFRESKNRNRKTLNVFDDSNIKANIGAWVANSLVSSGYSVLLLSRTKEKLKRIQESLIHKYPNSDVRYICVDMLDDKAVSKVINRIKKNFTIDYIHCVGLSSGNYKIKDDNPYLSVENTPLDLPTMEYVTVVKSLLIIVKKLMPVFKKQNESRIIVVSSMSAIRPVPLGFSHASAKAGIHFAVRSLALELYKKNIFVSEVLPGMVNTGLYDNPIVQRAVKKIGESFGHFYGKENLPQMHPIEVANAVKLCLTSDSHILSINLIAKNQWPHLGA